MKTHSETEVGHAASIACQLKLTLSETSEPVERVIASDKVVDFAYVADDEPHAFFLRNFGQHMCGCVYTMVAWVDHCIVLVLGLLPVPAEKIHLLQIWFSDFTCTV